MAEKVLSVFIDESGDFGTYDFRTPLYLVAMVLHNQDVDISKNIDVLENHLTIMFVPKSGKMNALM